MSSMLIMLSDNNSNPIATSTIITNQINVVNEESKGVVEEQKSLLSNFPPPPKTAFSSKITTTTISTSSVNSKYEYFDDVFIIEKPNIKPKVFEVVLR